MKKISLLVLMVGLLGVSWGQRDEKVDSESKATIVRVKKLPDTLRVQRIDIRIDDDGQAAARVLIDIGTWVEAEVIAEPVAEGEAEEVGVERRFEAEETRIVILDFTTTAQKSAISKLAKRALEEACKNPELQCR